MFILFYFCLSVPVLSEGVARFRFGRRLTHFVNSCVCFGTGQKKVKQIKLFYKSYLFHIYESFKNIFSSPIIIK